MSIHIETISEVRQLAGRLFDHLNEARPLVPVSIPIGAQIAAFRNELTTRPMIQSSPIFYSEILISVPWEQSRVSADRIGLDLLLWLGDFSAATHWQQVAKLPIWRVVWSLLWCCPEKGLKVEQHDGSARVLSTLRYQNRYGVRVAVELPSELPEDPFVFDGRRM